MPRRLLKKFTPSHHALRDRWFLRPFGTRITDPGLWSLQRRSVTAAFGAGLAICFVPLPLHLPLAAIAAIVWRLNLPTLVATVFLVNPLSVVPVYYFAYRVGTLLLGEPAGAFAFELSWDWLQYGLGPKWRPFLVGCLVCSVSAGALGWLGLEMLWLWRVRNRYRTRRGTSTG